MGTKQKDPREAGLFAFAVWCPSDVYPPEDAQHREAAEPVLTGAVGLVWIPVEALGGVVVVARAVTLVGEWAEAEAGVTAGTPVEGLAGVEEPVAPQAVAVAAVAELVAVWVVASAEPDEPAAEVERVAAALDEPVVGQVEFRVVLAGLAAE